MLIEEETIKRLVKEALDEWVQGVEYLHSPTSSEGRYYCSKPDCEGVRFQDELNKPVTQKGDGPTTIYEPE